MSNQERLHEVKQLISLGKEKGYLTYEEVNDFLPPEVVSPEQIDDIMMVFGEMDIDVIDKDQHNGAATETPDKESPEREFPVDDANLGRTDDPVRMYLREMGSIPLLSREGEIEIAKRIEEGQMEVIQAAISTPVAVRQVIALGERLKKGEIRALDITETNETDDKDGAEEERERARVLALIAKIRDASRRIQKAQDAGATSAAMKTVKRQQRRIVERIQEIALLPAVIDWIIGKIRKSYREIRAHDRQIRALLEEVDLSPPELRRILRECKRTGRRRKGRHKVDILMEFDRRIRSHQRSIRKIEQEVGAAREELAETLKRIAAGRAKDKQAKKALAE
ncbi:MAG: RNA polymerase sigma factor region1.1 domain-containing protein, partial [Nitrospinota bacterium]